MKSYLAILKARFLTLFQYRQAAIAGVATQVFWGLIYSTILTAFYGGKSVAALSCEQAITFIWINQALLQLIPYNIDKELEGQIRTGNVAYELVRPLDLYWHWFCRAFAIRTIPTLMRCIPLFCVACLFLGMQLPVTIGAAIAFTLSLILAACVASAITTLTMLSLFWTVSGEGILRLVPHITLFFSGLVVPLPLFPDWMQPFLSLQPFRCILDIPCRLYTGLIAAEEAIFYLLLQLVWALIFIAFGRLVAKRAMCKVVIEGG